MNKKKEMKKFAIIIEDMRMGGPQKQLIYFLQETLKTKSNFNYTLYVPFGTKKKLSKFLDIKKLNIKELNIHYLSMSNIINYIIFFFKDISLLKENLKNIENVYIAGGSSNLKSLIISIFLKKKIFFHIHDIKSNFLIKFFLLFASRFIKKIFFASSCSKKYYSFLSNCPKKLILRSSVDPKYFIKRKYKNKFFTIGIIANINPDKNLELFVKIVKKIHDKNIHFKIIGNLFGSQKNYFEKKLLNFSNIKNKIQWYQKIDNPIKIINSFDLLLCTSKYESLPLSIIESLSLSIPVISTDVGDVSYVLNKKKCGYVVKSNTSHFINKILKIKNNEKLKRKLSENARKNILKNFNIKNYKYKLEREILG